MISPVNLEMCYESIAEVRGGDIEPYASVAAVEAHRHYWRPPKVKVVLLAESRVYTKEEELQKFVFPWKHEFLDPPDTYVRFVYCLAYGEQKLSPVNVTRNTRTPQFWKIFYACLNRVSSQDDYAPILVSKTPLKERLLNKINLLFELQERGIWLVDASIAGLHKPGGKKPSNRVLTEALQVSWDEYVGDLIRDCAPKRVICIGEDLEKILEDRLHDTIGNRFIVLPQPQARMSKHEQIDVARVYWEVCKEYASLR